MGTDEMKLPDGFVLDKEGDVPVKPPDGFVLDSPFVPPRQPDVSFIDANMEGVIPTSLDAARRMVNPIAGQFGVSRFLESKGQELGRAVRSAGGNIAEKIATSKFGQENPKTAAGLGAAVSTVADVTSESLTPSSFQQQFGAEAPGMGAAVAGVGPMAKVLGWGDDALKAEVRSVFGKPTTGKEATEAAAKVGVKLTPAEVSGNATTAGFESLLEKMPFSSSIIQKFKAARIQKLEQAAEEITRELGSSVSPEEMGANVQRELFNKRMNRIRVKNKLFDRLTDAVKPDTPVPIPKVSEEANRIVVEQQALKESAQDPALLKLANDYAKPEPLTFRQVKTLRDELSRRVGPEVSDPQTFNLSKLKDAVDEDIATFAQQQGGNVESAWKKANAAHGAIKSLRKDLEFVEKMSPVSLYRFSDNVFQPGNLNKLNLLRKGLPETTYKKLQTAFVDKLFKGGQNQLPHEALISNVKKFGDKYMQTALDKQAYERIKEFAVVAERINLAEKIAGNTSGTARNLTPFFYGGGSVGGAIGAGYLMKSNPVGAVAGFSALVTPPALAKLYLSDLGRSLILKLAQGGVKGTSAVVIAKTLAKMAERNGDKPIILDSGKAKQ